MPRTPYAAIGAAAAAALLVAGCSSSSAGPRAGASASASPSASASASSSGKPGKAGSTPPTGTATSSPASGGTSSPAQPGGGTGSQSASPSLAPTSSRVQVRFEADCVARGGQMIVHVHSDPGRKIAWQAMYKGERGGGPKPYGWGYGGNAYGDTDPNGDYTSTWIVSNDAPLGAARVDATVALKEGLRTNSAPFRVVSLPTDC